MPKRDGAADRVICCREVGARLSGRRRALRLTQEQLSERAGISVSFLGHIERGTRIPSLETIARLSLALNCSTDYLLLGARLTESDHVNMAIERVQECLMDLQSIRAQIKDSQKRAPQEK